MSAKWWIDPSYDPMQDLQDCKHNQSLMIPALEEHAQAIRQLTDKHNRMVKQLQANTQTIRQLTHELQVTRLLLECEKIAPLPTESK